MRILHTALGAALLIAAATSAAAGERDHGRSRHPDRLAYGVSGHAETRLYASARSRVEARAYETSEYRSGGAARVVYLDDGYRGYRGYADGDRGGSYVLDRAPRGPVCPSAPFGYIVTGFGRDTQRPSWCGYRYEEAGHDRGGRYGYSERHDSYGESRYSSRDTYEEYDAEIYHEERGAWREDRYRDDDRDDRRGGCDCRDNDREPAPYPPAYLPEPPRYEPPRVSPPPARPHRPRPARPHRYERNAPGERG